MTRSLVRIAGVLLAATLVAGEQAATNRPETWARPVELEGVPNLNRVSPQLYRSAQPTPEGMRNLKRLGIITVVNLRSFHTDRDEIGDLDLGREHIFMKAWHPEREEVVRFLRIVNDPKHTPVLVHCQHGADRTGAMVAIYRIAVQGWTKEEALREMTEGGFGFHEVWQNLPRWVDDLDVEAIREEAAIAAPETEAEDEAPAAPWENASPAPEHALP